MIEIPGHIKIEEVPLEKRYRSVTAGLTRRIKLLYEAIEDKFGSEGLALIKEVGHNYGLEIAQRAKGKLKSANLKEVSLYVIRVFNTLRGRGKVVEFSPNQVIIRVWDCPYSWKTPEICQAHTQMEKTLVETLGDNLEYKVSKSIPNGDPYCDHIIKLNNLP